MANRPRKPKLERVTDEVRTHAGPATPATIDVVVDPAHLTPEPTSDAVIPPRALAPSAAMPPARLVPPAAAVAEVRAASVPEVLADDDDEEEDEEDEDDEDDDDADEDLSALARERPRVVDVTSPSAAASGAVLPARSAGFARSSALDHFLSQVGRYPVLSPDEERELTLAVYEQNDPVAARKLVVHNLRLVVKMAYKYRRAWTNMLDLVQEGNIGLMEAVKRFDPWKGARFSTYAAYWIRAYLIRYLLEHSRMVRISRTRAGRKLFFRLSKEREKLRAMGVEFGPALLAERLGVSEKDFEEVVKHMDQSEVRLDAPLSIDGDGDTVLDTLRSATPSPETAAQRLEFDTDVSKALEAFGKTLRSDRERAAWEEHLMAEDPIPLSQLGERFGVTKQRMGQIVMDIRKRLKEHLVRELGPDVQLDYAVDTD